MTKYTVKYYKITQVDGSAYQIDADYYSLDAGVYHFFRRDQDYQSHEVHEVNMLNVKGLASGYKEMER